MVNYLLLPKENHECNTLKVGILTNEVLIYNLQWYHLKAPFTALSVGLLDESQPCILLERLEISKVGGIGILLQALVSRHNNIFLGMYLQQVYGCTIGATFKLYELTYKDSASVIS